MPNKLNIFPARVAIGRVTSSGDVLMTPEFSRALADLMVRVGGPVALNLDELVLLLASEPGSDSANAALSSAVAALTVELAVAQHAAARIAALEQRVEDLARLQHSAGPAPVDWEHPGRLGEKTPNSARVTMLNKITFTQPATAATFTLADGKTFTVTNSIALAGADGKTFTLSNTLGLSGTDGAFLNIGNGGTLGSAAYQNATAFAARSSTALAPAATDAASTQTLANSLRAVLQSVGIGT